MTTLFLDVDDVLNGTPKKVRMPKAPRVTGWDDWETATIKVDVPTQETKTELLFAYSPRMIDSIKSLGLDIVWATSWVVYPELEDIAELFGLPTGLPRIHTATPATRVSCGKLDGVSQYVETHNISTFVWIDNDLGRDDKDWAEDYDALLVQPRDHWGLSNREFQTVEVFVNQKR